MRVYFDTNGDYIASPAARMWFYQMRDNLVARGIHADLNQLGEEPYDIAIIHWARANVIERVLEHSPKVHVGVLNPGTLGFDFARPQKTSRRIERLDYILNNTDFFIVTGFVWRDILIPFKKRVYLTIDYDTLDGKAVKHHVRDNNIIIGYHGSPSHFKEEFFPNGANALKRLAGERDFILRVITRNAVSQPTIEGVRTEYIEFDLSTFSDQIQQFDIGICPVLSDYTQVTDPLKIIRNPNRVNTLLFYGIPSVTSPTPQSCHDLQDGETVLFAVTEEGWYQSMRNLIDQPELRNYIGNNGRKMVEQKFTDIFATDLFIDMLREEIRYPK
ncbi:MAG: glycosyltransferase family 1 protein [Saprospiraceae bacterium]|nr:MAG: glycosyltransferase family 1 protein [Saprospiraceae bacterium]